MDIFAPMAPLLWKNVFHLCLMVPNLEDTQQILSDRYQVTWTTTNEGAATLLGGDGTASTVRNRWVYSREGPPYIEIIQPLEGGFWRADRAHLHHVGLWVEDLAGETARLVQTGMRLEATRPHPDSPEARVHHLAYLIGDDGFRVELCDMSSRDRIAHWIAD